LERRRRRRLEEIFFEGTYILNQSDGANRTTKERAIKFRRRSS